MWYVAGRRFRLLLILSSFTSVIFSGCSFFQKVVIWGHKLHTHTHSYIHYGYYKAFSHLGYETKWLDENDDITEIDFSNTLFLTEGQVDKGIPLRKDCFYVVHNCDLNKYFEVVDQSRIINLCVYLKPCEYMGNKKMDDYVFYNLQDRSIHMPWATDLLPHEIEENKINLRSSQLNQLSKSVVFVGSCDGTDVYGNRTEIETFKNICINEGFNFICVGGYGNFPSGFIGNNSNISLTKEAYLAPAIQSRYQCAFGYIPCRIFKNISYGKLGITNSKIVWEFFGKKIVYNADLRQLFYDAKLAMERDSVPEILSQMQFVQNKHTYLNRIESLINFIEKSLYFFNEIDDMNSDD